MKLYCQSKVEESPRAVVVSCIFERMLIEILCSVNNSPFQPCTIQSMSCVYYVSACPLTHSGALPWRVPIVPGVEEYRLQVNVTDLLNLTDSAVIEYQGKVYTWNMQFSDSNALLIFLQLGHWHWHVHCMLIMTYTC